VSGRLTVHRIQLLLRLDQRGSRRRHTRAPGELLGGAHLSARRRSDTLRPVKTVKRLCDSGQKVTSPLGILSVGNLIVGLADLDRRIDADQVLDCLDQYQG
jgi:hypothetical protein